MNEMETIDRAWRDAFDRGTPDIDVDGSDVRARVARRIAVRHRRRVVTRVVAAVCAGLVVAGSAVALRPQRHVEPAVNAQHIAVTDAPGGSLSIVFASSGSSQLHARPGTYEFDITGVGAGHEIALAGPGVNIPSQPINAAGVLVKMTARLRAGTYVLECIIPGHAVAGEKSTIVVQ